MFFFNYYFLVDIWERGRPPNLKSWEAYNTVTFLAVRIMKSVITHYISNGFTSILNNVHNTL